MTVETALGGGGGGEGGEGEGSYSEAMHKHHHMGFHVMLSGCLGRLVLFCFIHSGWVALLLLSHRLQHSLAVRPEPLSHALQAGQFQKHTCDALR